MAGIQTFREGSTISSDVTGSALFNSYTERIKRYRYGWAYYEGQQYNRMNELMNKRMVDRALYKYIQDIYNPTSRLANFYKGVIWRGSVDPNAAEEGAIPIEIGYGTNDEATRKVISHIFKISNINKTKNIHVLHGTTMGDAAFYIRDDAEHEQVRMEIIHPSTLEKIEVDNRGFVKSYVIRDIRIDNAGMPAVYREVCEHGENDEIIFSTYRDTTPYAWLGNEDETGALRYTWSIPYGFVPLVLTQHITEGNIWGKSAIWNSMGKIDAIDDEASMLHDQIRKTIDPALLANFKMGDADTVFGEPTATTDKPKPGRETAKVIYVDMENPKMDPIVTDLRIADISANIKQMLDNLENELPELRRDIYSNVATDTVLAARADVESKVIEARINYDASMVSALQMCISIGGMHRYPGYEGFNENSYKEGKMNFAIAYRDVFPKSEDEENAETKDFWTTLGSVVSQTQGAITPEMVMHSYGWDPDKIKIYKDMQMNAYNTGDVPPIDPLTGKPMGQ